MDDTTQNPGMTNPESSAPPQADMVSTTSVSRPSTSEDPQGAPLEPAVQATVSTPEAQSSDSTGTKILVVEDDKFLMKIYESKLKKEGFMVVQASNGEDALEKIRSEKPQLVLLDLIMPIKNGYEVLEEVKKDPALSGIPIIILSNLGQKADIEKGLEMGAIDFIVKANLSIQEVVEKIRSHL